MKTSITKISMLILFIFSCGLFVHAQDTSTTQKLLQYIFQSVDKNQVPTGFLEEYGCPILPMATFNGTLTDSNRIDMNLWRTLYLQLQTGYCQGGSNPLPAITSVNTTIKQNAGSGAPVPVPLLIGAYNTVRTDAFSSNLLGYNAGTRQIYDVPGRGQSPYESRNLFAACPNQKQTITGTETFVCNSTLTWNNTGKSINQLQIDFADGLGFQSITMGTPFGVSYNSTGNKRWTIKVTLSDNSVLQCYSDYYAVASANPSARFTNGGTVLPAWGIVAAVGGVHSGATVVVNYSNNARTNTLRKPLIIVEGYDVSSIAPSLQGDYTSRDFIRDINDPTAQGFDFNNELDDVAGYDLVFINFNNGTDNIQRNAAIVEEVIARVNANKVADNRFGNILQQNVVMGLSMGGLCARFALANMTKNSVATQTRLLITHDSPHRGANVPLGLQYLIRMMGGFQLFGYNVYDIYPDYNDAIGLLDAPATQEMLLYRSTSANTFVTNTFLDGTYRNMITFAPTDPQPTYRFVATSQGNECAHNLFNPGKTFVNLGAGISAGIDARVLFFRVPIVSYKLAAEAEAYALPNTGQTSKIARLYTINNLKLFGFIDIFKQLYNNTAFAPGNHMPVDGAPGSNYPLLDAQALNQLTSFPTFNTISLYIQFPLGPFLSGYFGAYAYNAGASFLFTFVPVGSALDVSPFNANTFTQNYVNGVNQSYPSSSETFIAQESVPGQSLYNNVHTAFTARNARFLINEMENRNNLENCSAECYNPYYIQGTDLFCSSGVYTVPGIQRGVTVTWSASPGGIVSLAPSGNSVTVTRVGNGLVTLTATIGAGCNAGTTATRQIIAGTVTPSHIDYSIDPIVTCNEVRVTTDFFSNATYTWSYFKQPYSGNLVEFPNSSSTKKLSLSQGSGTYNVGVTVTNVCGTGGIAFVTFPITCGGGGGGHRFYVSPNPVKNIINVSSLPAGLTIDLHKGKAAAATTGEIREITVSDKSGIVYYRLTYGKGTKTAAVSLARLKPGIYNISVFDGKQWESNTIVKE